MKKFFFLLLLVFIFIGHVSAVPAHAQETLVDSINARLEKLQARYGIFFKYKDFSRHPDAIKFSEISEDEYARLNAYLDLFEQEINKYPSGFFKDHGVRGIGLVRYLFTHQRPAQGLYIPKMRVMLFDILRFAQNKSQQRHAIHHEIFHMMDAIKPDFPAISDEAWASLNDPSFSYTHGEKRRLSGHNPYNYYAPIQPGFVTYYAMESVQEDEAEVFAVLMQKKHRKLIEQWAIKDKILVKKIQVMKDFMEYYHPGMDEAYLKDQG